MVDHEYFPTGIWVILICRVLNSFCHDGNRDRGLLDLCSTPAVTGLIGCQVTGPLGCTSAPLVGCSGHWSVGI